MISMSSKRQHKAKKDNILLLPYIGVNTGVMQEPISDSRELIRYGGLTRQSDYLPLSKSIQNLISSYETKDHILTWQSFNEIRLYICLYYNQR